MFKGLRKLGESLDSAFSSNSSSMGHANRVIDVGALGQVRLGPVFAEGGFSYVHSAELFGRGASKPVAVKRMAVCSEEARRKAQKEIDILKLIPPHPNLTGFYGSAFVGNDAFIALEMVDGGTLSEFLDRRRIPMSSQTAVNIFFDIMTGLTHLHAQDPPIACRDLKLENVLFDVRAKRFKICDFGSATTTAKRFVGKEIQVETDNIEENSSAAYRAPELCDLYAPDAFCCEKVDVWAAGCIWYALLFRDLPFDGMSAMPILAGAYEEPDISKYPQYPASFLKLLEAMLNPSVSKRADSFTVLEALCRLKGVEINSKLRLAGEKLRAKRKRDLSGEVSASAADSVDGRSSVRSTRAGGVTAPSGLSELPLNELVAEYSESSYKVSSSKRSQSALPSFSRFASSPIAPSVQFTPAAPRAVPPGSSFMAGSSTVPSFVDSSPPAPKEVVTQTQNFWESSQVESVTEAVVALANSRSATSGVQPSPASPSPSISKAASLLPKPPTKSFPSSSLKSTSSPTTKAAPSKAVSPALIVRALPRESLPVESLMKGELVPPCQLPSPTLGSQPPSSKAGQVGSNADDSWADFDAFLGVCPSNSEAKKISNPAPEKARLDESIVAVPKSTLLPTATVSLDKFASTSGPSLARFASDVSGDKGGSSSGKSSAPVRDPTQRRDDLSSGKDDFADLLPVNFGKFKSKR